MNRLLKRDSILKIANNYFYDSLLAINLNYNYAYGSILGIILVVQIISGIFLAMYYIPDVELAFDSIERIMREVPNGYIIRYTHANGAAFFFIIVFLHIARAFLYGSYTSLRKQTWFIGIIIFFIMILTAFIGYSLVFGQMSYWAIAVITNLLTIIPYYGQDIVQYIYGGYNIGGATLSRFYSLHYLLPFILVALTIGHLITLHAVGGTNPLGINNVRSISYINFHPYYTLKDMLGILLIFIIFIYIIFFTPNLLGHTDNYIPANPLQTPNEISPEFYLLPFYSILRSIPNKTLGVIGLVSAIFVLFIIPFIHLGIINTSKFRPIYKIFLFIFFLDFLFLMYIGHCPVSDPYITLGQIFTTYYFIFLLFLIPFISFLESFIFILLHNNYNNK